MTEKKHRYCSEVVVGFCLGEGDMTDMYLSRAHCNSRGFPPHLPTCITLT